MLNKWLSYIGIVKDITNSDTQIALKDFCFHHRPNLFTLLNLYMHLMWFSHLFGDLLDCVYFVLVLMISLNYRFLVLLLLGISLFLFLMFSVSLLLLVEVELCIRFLIYGSVNYTIRRSLWSSLMYFSGF